MNFFLILVKDSGNHLVDPNAWVVSGLAFTDLVSAQAAASKIVSPSVTCQIAEISGTIQSL